MLGTPLELHELAEIEQEEMEFVKKELVLELHGLVKQSSKQWRWLEE